MRKIYVNGVAEGNLRKNIGKKFKTRVERQRGNRVNATKSSKEAEIAHWLSQQNIAYKSEYAPEGLINPKTLHPLYFDFFLPQFNAAIEYDGIQHYKPIHGKKQLKGYTERDSIKTLYCRYKGIKLLRIPYTCPNLSVELVAFISMLNVKH